MCTSTSHVAKTVLLRNLFSMLGHKVPYFYMSRLTNLHPFYRQNPEFFFSYHTRLKMRDQIVAFNYLVDQQVHFDISSPESYGRLPRIAVHSLP